jgi:hypothetical protein
MKEKINDEYLCVLRKNKITNQIDVDYVKIEKPLSDIINSLKNICDNPDSNLDDIVKFINSKIELAQLKNYYRYCQKLNGHHEAFNADHHEIFKKIEDWKSLMLSKQMHDPVEYDIKGDIEFYKYELRSTYIKWHNAFSINKTYRLCHEDKSILTFSHRIDGWSNPLYQLTPNFSVEIKTNFGYGRSSYFYTKLKYKNIEITPFSEWIDYQFANFTEIVRYSKSHLLDNKYWLEAMEVAKDACNLSLIDENKFIEKYVIDECEKMVSGLEKIFTTEHFTLKKREKNNISIVEIDKKGHVLIEYRGEKISGALDFISKILEFENIASISSFIERIETCNKRIQPILVDESKIIQIKISNLEEERKSLLPEFNEVTLENNKYNTKKAELKRQMILAGQLNNNEIDIKKLNLEFKIRNPEYDEFLEKYQKVTETFKILTEQIQNLITVNNNILSYTRKILTYFSTNQS